MRVLHYYPKDNAIIERYVDILCNAADNSCRCEKACHSSEIKQLLKDAHFDILHIHGCLLPSLPSIVRKAIHSGTRVVLSPHGQLAPWINKKVKREMPLVSGSKMCISKAYAIIAMGRMEEKCIQEVASNKRTIIIRNCIITQSITEKMMVRQIIKTYQRVMDSDTLQLMDEDERLMMRNIIKVGITGDKRWLLQDGIDKNALSTDQWRHILLYAQQTGIKNTVDRGIHLMHLKAPDIDTENVACFYPDKYQHPQTIQSAIGLRFATENERLITTFKYLYRQASNHQLCISHLIELDKELREHDKDEDALGEMLKEKHLLAFARRIMLVVHDMTALEYGMMPIPPKNDYKTKQLKIQIYKQLAI